MNQKLKDISSRAQEGDIHSMFQLALMYIQGNWLVERDPEEALYWLNRVVKEWPSYYTGCIMNLVYGQDVPHA